MTLLVMPYDREVLMAVRALWAGTATEGQQKRAMEWIVLNLCHIGQMSFDIENERLSAMREGERHIGVQLARMREPDGLEQLKAWEKPKSASTKVRGENGRSRPSTD